MSQVTLQVLDGSDRGKIYRAMGTPITIGREDGNAVQLNDERVSRFHAKIQEDQGQLVLTDLESTNGTRVNGQTVQLSIVRVGDCIAVGRSLLLVGSPDQIEQRMAGVNENPTLASLDHTAAARGAAGPVWRSGVSAAENAAGEAGGAAEELRFELNFASSERSPRDPALAGHTGAPDSKPPQLPAKLSPAQAAQLAELLLYLHQQVARGTQDAVQRSEDGTLALTQSAWQRILHAEMELARYLHQIGHPE